MTDMYKLIMMITNVGIKRNKNCTKVVWRNRKALLQDAKGDLKKWKDISFLDDPESVLP